MSPFAVRFACRSLFFLGLVLMFQASTVAEAADVVSIEEHWELRVAGPDVSRSVPQIRMVMSPHDSLDKDYFLVNFNHRAYPEYEPGGIQVQSRQGEKCRATATDPSYDLLETDKEVISWVQRITLVDGVMTFEMRGYCATWGYFGGHGEFTLSHKTDLARLNDYQPSLSLKQSGVANSGSRTSCLRLKRLRWKTSDGKIKILRPPITVDARINP